VTAELVDLADVAVLQLDGQLGLGLEHGDEVRVAGDVRQDPLDRHGSLEALGADLLGLVHLGHAAGTDALEHQIRPDLSGMNSQRDFQLIAVLWQVNARTWVRTRADGDPWVRLATLMRGCSVQKREVR
jgi:hypothetical protein